MTDDALFDMQPARQPDEIPPGYRPSRQYAEATRAEGLAKFRAHHFGTADQPGCEQCHTAPDRAKETGAPFTTLLCFDGVMAWRSFAGIARRLLEGYYPDRQDPAVKPLAPPAHGQPGLFDG